MQTKRGKTGVIFVFVFVQVLPKFTTLAPKNNAQTGVIGVTAASGRNALWSRCRVIRLRGDGQMSVASSAQRTADSSSFASSHISEKRSDFRVLVSVAIVAIGLVVATYALAVHSGVSPNELGLMSAYP